MADPVSRLVTVNATVLHTPFPSKCAKMKKLFSKIETKIDNTSKEINNFIGKSFTIGRLTVTVEDILAEGER